MKKQVIALLATVLLVLGCAAKSASAGSLAGDTRFVRSGSNLGLTAKEVVEKNGPPADKSEKGCMVPFFREGQEPVPVPGDAWGYHASGDDAAAALSLCLVQGFVVAEKSQYMNREGGRMTIGTVESIDADLLKKALKDALESATKEKRQLPQGEEIEI